MSTPREAIAAVPRSAFRILYRPSAGELDLDFPVERLIEAVGDTTGVLWVDVEDRNRDSNDRVRELFHSVFKFHPLAIDDALTESHVPKIDDWGNYLYIVFHLCVVKPHTGELVLQELDVFLGRNYLVTYHAEPLPIFEQERLAMGKDPRDRLRQGADHVLYRLLELAIDQTLDSIESLDDHVDALQNEVISRPGNQTLYSIFRIKRSAIRLHKMLSPQREVLNRLARDPFQPIQSKHRVYFRDLYDHVVRIHDISEGLRDLVAGALDTYLSVLSNRTNNTMKTLTVVTVMFLPMSFLSGFFGMNFFGDNLTVHWSFPRVLLFVGTCLVMAVSPVVIWFQSKRNQLF